jgi:hypothetical protein
LILCASRSNKRNPWLLYECNARAGLQKNLNETFATENSGLANCAQLPPFGGSAGNGGVF